MTENNQQAWSQDLHALILEIKLEVDAARTHSGFLSPSKIADFEARYFLFLDNGLNEIPPAINPDSQNTGLEETVESQKPDRPVQEIPARDPDFHVQFLNSLDE